MAKRRSTEQLKQIADRLTLLREAFAGTRHGAATAFVKRAGLNYTTWINYERAVSRPGYDQAVQISDAFGVDLEWIYHGRRSGVRLGTIEALDAAQKRRDKARETDDGEDGPKPRLSSDGQGE